MNLTIEELNHMRHMDIMDLDREQLADIADIRIDTGKSVESRVRFLWKSVIGYGILSIGETI